jgi:hypothetical protein
VPKRTVTYGATDIVNPAGFVAQLTELAARMGVSAPEAAAAAAAAAPSPPARR